MTDDGGLYILITVTSETDRWTAGCQSLSEKTSKLNLGCFRAVLYLEKRSDTLHHLVDGPPTPADIQDRPRPPLGPGSEGLRGMRPRTLSAPLLRRQDSQKSSLITIEEHQGGRGLEQTMKAAPKAHRTQQQSKCNCMMTFFNGPITELKLYKSVDMISSVFALSNVYCSLYCAQLPGGPCNYSGTGTQSGSSAVVGAQLFRVLQGALGQTIWQQITNIHNLCSIVHEINLYATTTAVKGR